MRVVIENGIFNKEIRKLENVRVMMYKLVIDFLRDGFFMVVILSRRLLVKDVRLIRSIIKDFMNWIVDV